MDTKELDKITLAVQPFDAPTPGNLLESLEHITDQLNEIRILTPDDRAAVIAIAITTRLVLTHWLDMVEDFSIDSIEEVHKLNVH